MNRRCLLLVFLFAAWGRLPAFADSLWTQAQLDAAATSATMPLLWAEAHIYGGLDDQNFPVTPVGWDELKTYASIPAQAFIQAEAQPIVLPQYLELHRPNEIASRLLWDYDAFLSNVIYVENHAPRWQNQIFDLHFLEEIFLAYSADVTFRNGRHINDNLFLWSRPAHFQPGMHRDEYLFYMIQSVPVFFECAGRIWVEGDQMRWECAIINHSIYDWTTDINNNPNGGLLCFRARNSPDFNDPNGDRIYFYDVSRRRLKQSVSAIDGTQTPDYPYFYHRTNTPPYCNMLSKFNQAGDLYLTAESSPRNSVAGNRTIGMSCIHANVGWAVPVGSYQTVNASFSFLALSRADSWSRYE